MFMSYVSIRRPMKFTTVEELETAIQGYFDSCFAPVMETIDNPEYDAEKAKEYEEDYDIPKKIRVQKLNNKGEPIFENIRPLTITGLALALNSSRDSLLDYQNEVQQSIPEEDRGRYSDAIKRAKSFIENYLEEYMYNGKNQTSAIFVAKNNFGWVDRRETDLTTKGDKIEGNVVTFARQDGQSS